MKTMLIGELAKKCGIRPGTIRYYEGLGLVAASGRTNGGYRVYPPEAAGRLDFILKAKSIGLGLGEIGDIISLIDKGVVPCEFTKSLISDKISETKERIEGLSALESRLESLLKLCEENPGISGTCPVIESLGKKA